MFSMLKILFFPKTRRKTPHLKKTISYRFLFSFLILSAKLTKEPQEVTPSIFLFDSQFYFLSYWVALAQTLIFKATPSYFYILVHAALFSFKVNLKRSVTTKIRLKNKKFHAACRAFIMYVRSLKRRPLYIINTRYSSLINYFWPTRFLSSSIAKNLSMGLTRVWCKFFFLRKNKIFYKGRYARNRQTCRVIVYWTLWLNIIFIYGMYFYYYQFVFNFGYVWWGLFLFFASLVGAQVLKSQYYNVWNLYSEAVLFGVWLKTLLVLFIK